MAKIYTLLFLLFFISCGSKNDKRCFTREEAILSCQAEEIVNKQVSVQVAKQLCEPFYPTSINCYNL